MHVKTILAAKGSDVLTISPLASVQDAADLLRENRVGAVLVSEPNGSISSVKGDLVRA